MASNYLKAFPFTLLDLRFFTKQLTFKPLFDANGTPVVNWDGTTAIYDASGVQLYSGTGLSAADAITTYGISFPTYTSSSGLRNIDGLYNNLFNPTWGTTATAADLPFLQRTQVIFDNYVKPLAASDPNAFYSLKFAVSPDPATSDYAKTAANLHTANVADYTPRMISRTVTTAGATFNTEADLHISNDVQHLAKDVNGFTSVKSYGLLETLGQQDGQKAVEINGDIGASGFVADTDPVTSSNQEYFIGATNPGVAPVNGWFVLFGQFFDHGLDFVGKGGDGTKITITLAPDDPMYGVIDPTSGRPATQIVISRADVSGFAADGTPLWNNHTSPYIDQSQTYGSNEQVTNVLREWVLDPRTNTYRMGAGMLDGNTSKEWIDAFGHATNATLPTLNEIRAHLIETGRDDLTWNDVLNLRSRDATGHVIDTDTTTGGVQASLTGAALLLDMNPRFDTLRFENPLNPDAGAKLAANIATLATAAQDLGCSFGYDDGVVGGVNTAGTIYLTVPAGMLGSGAPATTLTGASALYFWVNFNDFSIKQTMAVGPEITAVDPGVQEAVGELLLASVGDHYIAGDGRVNENIGLTAVHHVFHEEHNYQVETIKRSITALDAREGILDASNTYPHTLLHEWQNNTGTTDSAGNYIYANGDIAWNDDMLFNAAKMTVEMEYQHTAVDQFARTITPNLHEFVGYNTGENATVSLDFSQVAYRFGHSTLRESIDLMDPNGSITDHVMRVALERAFLSPEKFAAVGAGALALGMTHQQANEIDEFLTPALNQGLLGQPLDLAAINIARGRDLGIPTLNDMREALQLTRYSSWADFGANMIHPDNLVAFIAAYSFDGNLERAQAILDLANDVVPAVNSWGYDVQKAVDFLNNSDPSLYGCDAFNQIDCWLGGLAEVHVTGGLLGETFDTIFVDQIGRLMDGDRFYYLQRLSNIPYGQQIIDEQFKDIIERTTGVEHLNGSAFGYADQYFDFAGQEVANAKAEHKYGDALSANPEAGIYTDGGTTTGLNGDTVTINGVSYIRDVRTASAETKSGDPAGFALDGAPNSGADSHEVIVGTDRNDFIYARGGDDTVYGEAGKDIIYGGGGIDRLYGGDGTDIIYGDDGGDLIDGGDGDDVLYGGQSATAAAGVDQVIGSAGNDYVDGGIGIDKLSGSEGDDVIFGGGDTDAFTHGGDGNDYVDGGVTGDLLWGDNGDDLLVGAADQDIVAGMEGDDILRPGPLSQSLTNGGDEVLGGDGVSDAGNDGKGVGFDLLDLSDWQAAPKGAAFDLVNQNNPLPAIDGAPQFPAVAQIEGVIGTRNADTFVGDGSNNWLIGGSGNDSLSGGIGNDLIVGDGVRLDTLIGTYDSTYSLYFDGASHRAFGYTDGAQTTGLDRNFLQANGLLDALGWGDQKHFTEMLKSAMFKDLELGGSEVKQIWRNGVAQTSGESAGSMGDGGVAGALDTAQFTGNFADYQIETKYFDLVTRSLVSSASATTIRAFKITDTVAGRDGQDVVLGVEQLKFADRTLTFSQPALDLHAFEPGNYRDQFGSVAYSNSNGSTLWTTTWTEQNDRAATQFTTVQSGGEIRLNNSALEFRQDPTGTSGNPLGATIQRGVDLSSAGNGTAVLTFNWSQNNQNRLDNNEKVDVLFSADASVANPTWVSVQTLGNGVNTSGGSITASLTGPFTANAAIRFVFSGVTGTQNSGGEYIRIDNVDVSFVKPVNDGTNNWSQTYTEDGPSVGLSSLSSVSGSDTLSSATIVLTNAKVDDSLSATGLPAGITSTTTNVNSVITLKLSGVATAAAYQAAIDTIRFSNSSQAPDTTDRVFNVTVNNGLSDSNVAVSTIHVVSIDDPMVANNDTVITNVAANTAINVKVADLLANDTDLDSAVAITAITGQSGLASTPTLNTVAGTIAVIDNTNASGAFTYRGTGTDTANVTVTRQTGTSVIGTSGNDILIGNTAGSTLDGRQGDDRINGGTGDDSIIYTVSTQFPGQTLTSGRDIVDGGANGTAGDRFVLNGTNGAETFRIFSNTDDWDGNAANGIVSSAAHAGITGLQANAKIVITRGGTLNAQGLLSGGAILAELSNIEEITVNTLDVTANNNNGGLDQGGTGGDTVQVIGNFTNTGLAYSTITINDDQGNATVDISGLTSEHRIVFNTNSGGTVVGNVRAQDVVNTHYASSPPPGPSSEPSDDGVSGGAGAQNGIIYAEDTAKVIHADGADNIIVGNDHGMVIFAGAGSDTVDCGAGRDVILAGDGDDIVSSGNGDDLAWGDDGCDILSGGDGADMLFGGSGDDELQGGADRDRLDGGAGVDILFGGDGQDGFVFRTVSEANGDTIADFEAGDTVNLHGLLSDSAESHFSILSSQSFTSAGQLIVVSEGDGHALVQGTVTSADHADFTITVHGDFTLDDLKASLVA